MGRGPKKHQKRLSAPSHWLLDKLSGAYAPKASPGPHVRAPGTASQDEMAN